MQSNLTTTQLRLDLVRASTAFSLEAAMKSLCEEGFIDLDDLEVGELVSNMEQRGFLYLSFYGLDYCKQYVLDDTVRATRDVCLLSNVF